MPHDFSRIWQRIRAHEGARFRLARGKEITYSIAMDVLHIDESDSRVHISQFKRALEMVPVDGPKAFDDANLWGPSYLYAILMDQRIRQDDW